MMKIENLMIHNITQVQVGLYFDNNLKEFSNKSNNNPRSVNKKEKIKINY